MILYVVIDDYLVKFMLPAVHYILKEKNYAAEGYMCSFKGNKTFHLRRKYDKGFK